MSLFITMYRCSWRWLPSLLSFVLLLFEINCITGARERLTIDSRQSRIVYAMTAHEWLFLNDPLCTNVFVSCANCWQMQSTQAKHSSGKEKSRPVTPYRAVCISRGRERQGEALKHKHTYTQVLKKVKEIHHCIYYSQPASRRSGRR